MRHNVYLPPSPYVRLRPPAGPNGRLALIAAVAATAIILIGGVSASLVLAIERNWPVSNPMPVSGGPVTASTPIVAATGTAVFTDDFRDPQSGWDTVTGPSDINYGFTSGAYQAVAKGAFLYYEPSPYEAPKQQLSIAATATLDAHTPLEAGFGVMCARGTGSSQLRYEFAAYADSNWDVTRSTGVVTDTNFPTTLAHGSLESKSFPGLVPVTLTGVCATMADGSTTRLAFFVNETKVADLTDVASANSTGWWAYLLAAGSSSGPVTVTVTRFVVRDLSRSGP